MHRKFILALALLLIAAVQAWAAATVAADASVSALLDRARLWESRGRPELARETLEKLFRVAPENPDGLAALALLEAKFGNTDRARLALNRLRRAQPAHPGIPRIEASLRVASGEDKDKLRMARQLAKRAQQGHPELLPKALAAYRDLFPSDFPDGDIALEYWQLLAEKSGSWAQVHAGLARLVKDHPDNLRYRYALAEHETSRLPLNRQALAVIIEMTRLPEFQGRALAAWRRGVMRLEPSAANLKFLQEYLQREPADPVVLARVKEYAQAEESLRRLMADPIYRARRDGLALLEGGDLDAAEAHFERALRELPEDPEITGGLGTVRLRQGHHAQAQGLFEQALRALPAQANKWQALIAAAQFWGLMREVGDARSAGELRLAEDKLREAMLINPQEVAAVVALARIRADQGDVLEAERNYRKALEIDTTSRDALTGLIGLYARNGKLDEARQMTSALNPELRAALKKDLDGIEAGMLRQQADALTALGRTAEAAQMLEQAIHLDADDPWLRFGLARLYAAGGERSRGLALIEDLLARRPQDAAVLYALALYRSGNDESLEALYTLERIGPLQRDAKTAGLQRELWVRVQTQRARDAGRDGHAEAARAPLLQAEKAVAGDIELSTEVALAWADVGELSRAKALFDMLRKTAPSLPPQWYLRYAGVLARLGAEDELTPVLERLAATDKLSAAESERLLELRESAALRAFDAHLRAGRIEAARAALTAALEVHPDLARLHLAKARLHLAEGSSDAAEEAYRRVLSLAAEEIGARDGLVRLLIAKGRRQEALSLLDGWQTTTAPTSIATRVTLAGLFLDLNATAKARLVIDEVLQLSPQQPRALAYAAQIARQENRLDDAIDALKLSALTEFFESIKSGEAKALSTVRRPQAEDGRTVLEIAPAMSPPAPGGNWEWKSLAGMLDERASWLSSAVDSRDRKGTPGASQYNATEIPIEWRLPRGNSESLSLRADLVQVRAGKLDLTDSYATRRFGSLALCQQTANCPDAGEQTAQGTSLDVGYRSGRLRFDIGTTPIGFPVVNVIGGIATRGDLGQFGYSIDASRRPLTSSLLSYAGTRDPLSGRVWGGVVASGVRLGLSRDEGGALGFWSSLGAHSLTGENVKTNNRIQLMAGTYWRMVNRDDRLLSIGLTGMDWRFSDNVGEYSFGHGGYFSPRSYSSVSAPLTYAQRFTRFSYSVRAAVSTSRSSTDSAVFFPTDAAMQAAAIARGVDATYAGSEGPGKGRGRSFHAGWEYQLQSRLFVGGRIEIERSENYTPNRAMFYLRYNLDRAAAQPVALQQEPVNPTSQY
ncbi:MAG: cellulose synthase subunit BcsC-related outer membrane protein [Proteobacteria bacterium]|nr:cellulose synthase subunit BcsC-related outer membrane protein [Pseudomonadota bacterium]